jgi:hypothetical protein
MLDTQRQTIKYYEYSFGYPKKLKDIIDKRSIGKSDVFIRQINQNWSHLGHGVKQKPTKHKTKKRKR